MQQQYSVCIYSRYYVGSHSDSALNYLKLQVEKKKHGDVSNFYSSSMLVTCKRVNTVNQSVPLRLTAKRATRKPRAAQARGHNWTSINKIPLTDEEDIFEDYESAPMDLGIEDDDNDTEYEDIAQAAAEDDSQPAEEVIVVKPARV